MYRVQRGTPIANCSHLVKLGNMSTALGLPKTRRTAGPPSTELKTRRCVYSWWYIRGQEPSVSVASPGPYLAVYTTQQHYYDRAQHTAHHQHTLLVSTAQDRTVYSPLLCLSHHAQAQLLQIFSGSLGWSRFSTPDIFDWMVVLDVVLANARHSAR